MDAKDKSDSPALQRLLADALLVHSKSRQLSSAAHLPADQIGEREEAYRHCFIDELLLVAWLVGF